MNPQSAEPAAGLDLLLGRQLRRIRQRFLTHGLGYVVGAAALALILYYPLDRYLRLPGAVRVLLTLGIGTGIVVNAELHEPLLVMGPKQIFPMLAWVVFAGILIARPALGFRGRKSAYLTIAGFALGVLTVLGMTL